MSDEMIKICSNHRDYEVPLICTFAFKDTEYWCPYCGYREGILGAGETVEATRILVKRAIKYEKVSDKFLRAHARLNGGAHVEYKGKIIPATDLPESMLSEYRKNLKWEYEKRID